MTRRFATLALAVFLTISTIGCALSKADRQVIIENAGRFAADKAGALVEGLVDKAKAKLIQTVEEKIIPAAKEAIVKKLEETLGADATAMVATAVETAIGGATDAFVAVVDAKKEEVTALVEARAGAVGEKIAKALTKEAEQENKDNITGIVSTVFGIAVAALGGRRLGGG